MQILNDGDSATKTQIEHQNTVLDTATKHMNKFQDDMKAIAAGEIIGGVIDALTDDN